MNREKVHYIVEYIRTRSDFPFDLHDLRENLSQVLEYYGFDGSLSSDEAREIVRCLEPLASEFQTGEVERLSQPQKFE